MVESGCPRLDEVVESERSKKLRCATVKMTRLGSGQEVDCSCPTLVEDHSRTGRSAAVVEAQIEPESVVANHDAATTQVIFG
jgi:hypothetical protein